MRGGGIYEKTFQCQEKAKGQEPAGHQAGWGHVRKGGSSVDMRPGTPPFRERAGQQLVTTLSF